MVVDMVNRQIAILTDSTCDIPSQLLEEYSIYVQSHVLIWDGRQYRDRVDMLPEEFYRRLAHSKTLPTTSQASAQDFSLAYQRAYENGASSIVAILVNSTFSGAVHSAQQAAAGAQLSVSIHDSRGASMGLGWQVLAAARARDAGEDVAGILDAAEQVRRKIRLIVCLDTLEYLYRGGRIGNARRLLGTMLNLKPLIEVNHDKGIVEPAGRAMTRRNGLDQLYKSFFAGLGSNGKMHIAVMHGDAAGDAEVLVERVQQEYQPVELLTNITGPALGINTGPRAIALIGYSE